MTKKTLEKIVLEALEDFKAIDIVDLDVHELTSITDRMIICTGTSKRHLLSLAENVAVKVKAAGFPVIGTEGKHESEWVLVDLGDIIVHIMLAATREFYSLEKLWHTSKQFRQDNK